MFKVISSHSLVTLEGLVNDYDIGTLGSLVVSNGQYYLAFIGNPKVKPKVTEEIKSEPEPEPEVPKVTKAPAAKLRPTKGTKS